jgi:trimeric autotransporter adhesin
MPQPLPATRTDCLARLRPLASAPVCSEAQLPLLARRSAVFSKRLAPGGVGLFAHASASSGTSSAITGQIESPNGVAGYFVAHAGSGLILLGTSGSNNADVFSVDASGNGFFAGNLNVTGKLTKGSGSFKIDHPIDPANKYLSHSFVESPDMMNVYNGNITTDRHGLAMVNLPDYFEALNGDFRYQLTVIGQFAQAIVAEKIASNRFVIRTSKPNVEVSWQVTGIRHDAYADAYRIPTEEEKPAAEQGYYLHPEVFGQPASKSIQAASQKTSAPDQLAKVSNP